ncbi:hypothetical protein Krac_4520 [Ktedonobacter racemifer DSM 44963]|uniref:Uncharacterized protein n=1 Tax=Ktedonobacter racemifer DSM 44963 TaxID=485913 RepID=D6TSY9_KTERA|nr:hypothetical protein Krac_4520 [Ktedonobacter racemifer DSM 44963]
MGKGVLRRCAESRKLADRKEKGEKKAEQSYRKERDDGKVLTLCGCRIHQM